MRSEESERSASAGPTPRTEAEWDAFAAATHLARTQNRSTPAETAYLDELPRARRDILHRLVCGLLRGRPAELPAHVLVATDSPTVPDGPEPLSETRSEDLIRCVQRIPDDCQHLALQPFPATSSVVICPLAAIHGYDRFRPVGQVRQWQPDAATRSAPALTHPIDVVPLLEREGAFVNADQVEQIRDELAESAANLALARIAEPPRATGAGSTIDTDSATGSVLDAVTGSVAAADPTTAFERIVTDGHPFHPAGKIRRGMTATDGLAYAPEFTDRIDLRFVAVHRDRALEVQASGTDRLTDRLRSTFLGLEDALAGALPRERDPTEYAVIPVHPWQYHHTILERYASQRADDIVVPLTKYTRPVTPQLNLRTVVPYATEDTADGPLPHLKLAIDVQTTNVVRTLSPQAVTNGPQITEVLAAIESKESFERLGLLSEPAATCYWPSGGPHLDGEGYDDVRHLSGMLRTNPRAHPLVADDAQPVVASSLLATTPATGRPLVCDLIEQYGAAMGTTDTGEAALEFVDAYADVVVPEQLLLLCKYGVALESHLQNSLAVFDDARPIATLVRDFGGIRVHGERLAEHGFAVEPYPESDVDADGEDDLYRKLYYALFQNHLAELVATISYELGVEESACWNRIRERCERAFRTIRSDHAVPEERVQRDRQVLFDDPMVHKALTAMRLRGKRHEYVTSNVANPLAERGKRTDEGRE